MFFDLSSEDSEKGSNRAFKASSRETEGFE